MTGRDELATAVAGGPHGADVLGELTGVVLTALTAGAVRRGGPLPGGGPGRVSAEVRSACAPVLPTRGTGAREALDSVVRTAAAGAADPADPLCVAHLHCPPLALAAAADLAASALNPSMDSWDQAPAAGAIEDGVTAALARTVYPSRPSPDALVTTGGTESNLVALLLARERARAAGAGTVTVVRGENSHHSVDRAAWMLGLAAPLTVPTPDGTLDPAALGRLLAGLPAGPGRPRVLVVATAGTTDSGLVDPLPELARTVADHGAELHVDAAYGGPLLFSDRLAPLLAGVDAAVSVTFDLHKLGWQPVAAGLLAVADRALLEPLDHRAEYLNAGDDTEAGLPDLLGRSLRTSRRPDALKIAATFRALGRDGLARLVEHCVDTAAEFVRAIDAHPALRSHPSSPGISTVLLRPLAADALPAQDGDALVARVRRRLLTEGRAVLGRARVDDPEGPDEAGHRASRLWLKVTLLHPHTRAVDLDLLLRLIVSAATEAAEATAPDGAAPSAAAAAPGSAGGCRP